MSEIKKDVEGREVQVYGVGVVDMENGGLVCNQENLLSTVKEMVNEMRPKTDYYGKFAAAVTITITLLGEKEEENG